MGDLISRSEVIKAINAIDLDNPGDDKEDILEKAISRLYHFPTAYDVDAVVGDLEKKTEFLKDCTKYGNESAEQQEKSYAEIHDSRVLDWCVCPYCGKKMKVVN